jgi:hypothetical protein
MFRQIPVGVAASACNISIHALIMVALVQISLKTSKMLPRDHHCTWSL